MNLIIGLFLGFKPEKMTILPYGLKINFKPNDMDFNKRIKHGNVLSIKRIILALGGPITNIICILIAILIRENMYIEKVFFENIIYANLLIAIFNMLPIYPLDGGRVIKEITHIFIGLRKSYRYTQIISEICLYIITALSSVLILYYKNIAIFIVVTYLWFIVYKNKKEIRNKEKIYKTIEKYNNMWYNKNI